jgi:hypothetical protein
VVFMDHGSIVEQNTPEQFFSHPSPTAPRTSCPRSCPTRSTRWAGEAASRQRRTPCEPCASARSPSRRRSPSR